MPSAPFFRLLVCAAVAAAAAAGPAFSQKLPEAQRAKIAEFAVRFWKARPPTRFDAWDPAAKKALDDEAAALGALPEGAFSDALATLWKPAAKHGPRIENESKPRLKTPYGEAKFILRGSGKGKGLVVGLHGGGEGAGDAGEAAGNWRLPDCLGMYPQGIRLVHDTWNTVHGERFVLTLLEIAKAQFQVDPDRVYVMGFSMGGTGSWFMGGRHPDLFAGAAPCAGVLMAQPKSQLAKKEEVEAVAHGLMPNVRNLAMWSFIGTADRNCMPGTFMYVADRMEELKKDDPDGYRLWNFKLYPGLAHAFPPGEPAAAFKFFDKRKRDALPKKLVWEYASDPFPQPVADDATTRLPKRHFYWLRCDDPRDYQVVKATRDGNAFTLDVAGGKDGLKGFSILLNPSMIDPAQDVVVTSAGKEVYRGRPAPSFAALVESLDARCDTTLAFDRRVDF